MPVLQGTLDLLVLRALSWGPMHGYAVITWLRQRTDEELLVEDTAVYPALHRLESRGLIESEWGLSENNRRAKFYRITSLGRAELRAVTDDWTRYVGVMAKVLRLTD
jgi:transcriptional regulator